MSRRKIGEEALREKKPAADVIETIPIGVAVMDLEGKVLQDNEAARKMFGYEKGESIGRSATELISEEDVPRALEALREGIERGYYRNFECMGVTKNGRRFPVLVDGTLMRDAEGNPSLSVITFRDITELKRTEEELKKRAEELKRAYKELAVLERARAFTFILFKDVLEPLLRECGRRTIGKIKDQVSGLGKRLPLAKGVRIGSDRSVTLDEASIREVLGGETHDEAMGEITSTFSAIMDACDPIIRADIGEERATATVSGAFSSIFERPEVSTYRADLVRIAPNGVEIPREYILLEPRRSYLVEERKPVHAFKIFSEAVRYGSNGLCVTTLHPDDVKREHGLGEATVIWLSKHGDISPANLGILRDTISRFMGETENTVVLLDGLEYLIATHGFDLMLKFLYDVMELVTLNRSRLIVPVSPAALGARELALLERSMEPIEIVAEE